MPRVWLSVRLQTVYDTIREGFDSAAQVDVLTVHEDAKGGRTCASGRAVPSTAASHRHEPIDDGRHLDAGMRCPEPTRTPVG
jgi:hypothetical protein